MEQITQCPSWCDQGDRPHTIHEQTVLTLVSTSGTPGSQSPMTAQLIVAGTSDATARPVLALVDGRLEQRSVALDWPDAHELGRALIERCAWHRRATQTE